MLFLMFKKIIQRFILFFPEMIQKNIYKLWIFFHRPKLISANKHYTYTDEDLKFVHILEGINYLRIAGSGGLLPQTYFEFGCHSGRTFSAAVNAGNYFGMTNAQYYAFDSFEGLPETKSDDDGFFETGTFSTSRSDFVNYVELKTGLRLDDKCIIQGFYSDSLTSDLQALMPKAGIVHIDVDLYSSTVDVLRFIKPLLVQGTLLIFDDWYCFPGGSLKGERRALTEFLADNIGISVEPWKAYSTFGQSFFVTKLPDNLTISERA